MTIGREAWVLSGGLASGKSMVREQFEDHGLATIDADSVGHLVLERDGAAFSEVAARWPSAVESGEISRPALASIVFGDRAELSILESITHPYIFDMIRTQVERIDSTVVVEIPLLRHGLGDGWRRIVVDGRDDVRLRRAVDAGMDEADARGRMASQPTREEWLAAADLVIPNHGSVSDLEQTVMSVVGEL